MTTISNIYRLNKCVVLREYALCVYLTLFDGALPRCPDAVIAIAISITIAFAFAFDIATAIIVILSIVSVSFLLS